ncbi:hypothetical protein ACS0TY_021895 [Phlomoides rotata]
MGGFTRILHSGNSDKFMDEIPTFVAQPLPSGLDQRSSAKYLISTLVLLHIFQGYVVLNRPWAFVQWLLQTEIEEE